MNSLKQWRTDELTDVSCPWEASENTTTSSYHKVFVFGQNDNHKPSDGEKHSLRAARREGRW